MKISIIVLTYNQDLYIEQTLLSILSQNGTFEKEIIIGNDCSTDNTENICQKYQELYPNTIYLLNHKKNLGLVNNYISCLEKITGDYVALCDGDDYWIDQDKLIKESDILNRNQTCGIVYTNKKMLLEDGTIIKGKPIITHPTKIELLLNNFICVPTAMFRMDALVPFISAFKERSEHCNWLMQDYPTWLFISQNYSIIGLDEYTVMYRVFKNSLSRKQDSSKAYEFDRSILSIKESFYDKLNLTKKEYTLYDINIFHARKRMLITYGRKIAKEQIKYLLKTKLSILYLIIQGKISKQLCRFLS